MGRTRLFLASVGLRTSEFPVITPPLGILSLSAYLRNRMPLDMKLLDQRLDNTSSDDIVRSAAEFNADVIGFGVLTPFAPLLPELALKARKALPNALIVLGGPHVTGFGAGVMDDVPHADMLITGEGELALEQVLQARAEGNDYGHIPGLVWRNAAGEITVNPGPTPMLDNLDTFPFLAYDLIDLPKYWRHEAMANVPPRKYIGLFSSRGCPYGCIYCHRIFGKRFRAQSAERVIAEIEHLQKTYGVHEIEFYDDIFNQDPRRMMDFCDMALRQNLKLRIAFPNGIRGDTLTPDMIDALVDAGMYYTCCPLESGSAKIQKYMEKHLDIPRFLAGVDKLVRRRVFTYGLAMLGFPTETEEDIQQTIDTICNSSVHLASFFTVTPYPNTELYDRVMQTHPEKLSGFVYRGFPSNLVNLSEVPDHVLYAYQRKALRRFFFNPIRMLRLASVYPNPLYLPKYVPMLARQLVKGIFV
ncbi:MAG TPA: radical SAM protein [Candidatus Hydrogenedentes bacterium]|nr:radical SAM protein [Candidatus Hydrogenedentota bacterium]HRT21012.1 radical SAM protein [Candidatus Hydrogenedentota bacterium]HRT65841.1 radical SAM protein [Candidatus Hydrogenedentota bacterium]